MNCSVKDSVEHVNAQVKSCLTSVITKLVNELFVLSPIRHTTLANGSTGNFVDFHYSRCARHCVICINLYYTFTFFQPLNLFVQYDIILDGLIFIWIKTTNTSIHTFTPTFLKAHDCQLLYLHSTGHCCQLLRGFRMKSLPLWVYFSLLQKLLTILCRLPNL